MSGDDPHLVLCQKTPSPEVELVLFLHLEVEVNMSPQFPVMTWAMKCSLLAGSSREIISMLRDEQKLWACGGLGKQA